MKPLTFHKTFQLSYQQSNLHQLSLLTQNSTLPEEISQAHLIQYHMRFQHKNIPKLLLMNQMSTIQADIPQDCHIYSHLTYQWWRLSQIHYIHQVTIPVYITPHYHKKKRHRIPFTLSPTNKSTQVWNHHYPPIKNQWELFWILPFLLVLYPVPLEVLITQIYSYLLIGVYLGDRGF